MSQCTSLSPPLPIFLLGFHSSSWDYCKHVAHTCYEFMCIASVWLTHFTILCIFHFSFIAQQASIEIPSLDTKDEGRHEFMAG
jgi:hypothetical protein